MAALGDLLQVLHTADVDPPTIHARAEQRRDDEASTEAGEAAANELMARMDNVPRALWLATRALAAPVQLYGLTVRLRRRTDRLQGPVDRSALEFWFSPPSRVRIDQSWDHEGTSEHVSTVVDRFDPERLSPMQLGRSFDGTRRRSIRGGWGCNEFARMFWRPQIRQILDAVQADETTDDVVAGRPVVRVRARPRLEGQLWPHWLPYGADHYDLAFDREHGFLLGYEGWRNGNSLAQMETTEVTYREPIDDITFVVDES